MLREVASVLREEYIIYRLIRLVNSCPVTKLTVRPAVGAAVAVPSHSREEYLRAFLFLRGLSIPAVLVFFFPVYVSYSFTVGDILLSHYYLMFCKCML